MSAARVDLPSVAGCPMFHDRRNPALMGETEIAAFLTHLANEARFARILYDSLAA